MRIARTLIACTLLLAAWVPAALCQQAHVPEPVEAQTPSAPGILAETQGKPARQALPPGAKREAVATQRVSYEVPVVQQSFDESADESFEESGDESEATDEESEQSEPSFPEPKFSLIPTCPTPVPTGTMSLAHGKPRPIHREQQQGGHGDGKHSPNLAQKLRLAADEEIIFYGESDAPQNPGKKAETLPPGLPVDNSLKKCDRPCSTCCKSQGCSCGREFWRHRSSLFGNFVAFEPSGADVRFAQRQGLGGAGGEFGTAQTDFEAGWGAGITRALSDCTSVSATFAQFRSHTVSELSETDDGTDDVQSLNLYPGSNLTGVTSGFARASYDIDFETVDVDLRQLLSGGPNHALNWTAGARYGRLEQNFQQGIDYGQSSQVEVATDIDFDGVGLRLGLDGEQRAGCSPLSFYGKTFIDVLFGEFSSEYRQTVGSTPSVDGWVQWDDDRTVPVLELELGCAWTEGNWRLTAGYYAGFWFNAVTTPELISAVQSNHYVDVDETLTFHGLVTRLECRF